MKVAVVLLTVMVQLMAACQVSKDDGRRSMACWRMSTRVADLGSKALTEKRRVDMLFGSLVSIETIHLLGKCVRNVHLKNGLAMMKEVDNYKECPKVPKDDFNECTKMNILRLNCFAKVAKNFAKLLDANIEDFLACPVNFELARRTRNNILAQKSELEYDKTIIYEMEEAQRQYKEEKIW